MTATVVAYAADSTDANAVPDDLEYYWGYINGKWQSYEALLKRFEGKGKRIASVDVLNERPDADILDVEKGDATPADSASWIERRKALKPEPEYPGIIYCNRGNITDVFNAMEAKGYKIGKDFRTIIATLDGTTHVDDMTGVTAVQYAGTNLTKGNYDQSAVYDATWLAPAVVEAPPPPATKTVAQASVNFATGELSITYSDGSTESVPAGDSSGQLVWKSA